MDSYEKDQRRLRKAMQRMAADRELPPYLRDGAKVLVEHLRGMGF